MQEPKDRLQEARRKAGYLEATEAARAFGWNENTYRSHENGERGIRRDVAEKYARAFKVTATWLLMGEGKVSRRNIYPVWGYVGLGESIELVEGDSSLRSPLEHIELPFGFGYEHCGALIARGNSQYPRIRDGEVVLYERTGTPPSDLTNQECIVQLKSGMVVLKTIRRTNGGFSLESHNAPLMLDVDIEWAGRLLAIVPAGQWKKIIP